MYISRSGIKILKRQISNAPVRNNNPLRHTSPEQRQVSRLRITILTRDIVLSLCALI